MTCQLDAQSCATQQSQASAARLRGHLAADSLPSENAWNSAEPIRFCADWQGKNPDAARETEVRVLWSPTQLYIRFNASYRTLYTFAGGNQRRDELWTRDVAEVFLQPAGRSGFNYTEIEVSPNGDWLDLLLTDGQRSELNCPLKMRVEVHPERNAWRAEIGIPMHCLTEDFDPRKSWRVNFFRVEGADPNRFYSSWRPTNTPAPNFHVPEAFVPLNFQE